MKITIRKVNINDGQQVLSLLKELKISGYQEMGFRDIKVKVASNALDFYKKIIKRPDVLCLLAGCDGEICGLCFAYLTPTILDGGYRLLVERMVVKQEFRGKGVGTVLIKAVEQEAKKRGVTLIKAITGTKLRANEFYKKHGFVHFENAYRKKL